MVNNIVDDGETSMTPSQRTEIAHHLAAVAASGTYGFCPGADDPRLGDVLARIVSTGTKLFGDDGVLLKGMLENELAKLMATSDAQHLFQPPKANDATPDDAPADPETDQWGGMSKEAFLALPPSARLHHANRRDAKLRERSAKRNAEFGEEAARRAQRKHADVWESLSVEHRLTLIAREQLGGGHE